MRLFSRKKRSKSSMGSLKRSGKRLLLVTGCMLSLMMLAPVANNATVDNVLGIETVYAAESTFSEFWFQDTDGSWKVRDNTGNIVKNAWLCDDAVASNGQNVWYLLDDNGNMLTQGLVQDQTGNYYSLETNHNGFYGMLRYQSGTYDGVSLSLESSHSGGFAKILNQDGINALSAKYGVTNVSISNANCVYTSTFKSSSSNSKPGGGSGGGATENNIPGRETDGGYDLGGGTGGYTIPEKEIYVPGS